MYCQWHTHHSRHRPHAVSALLLPLEVHDRAIQHTNITQQGTLTETNHSMTLSDTKVADCVTIKHIILRCTCETNRSTKVPFIQSRNKVLLSDSYSYVQSSRVGYLPGLPDLDRGAPSSEGRSRSMGVHVPGEPAGGLCTPALPPPTLLCFCHINSTLSQNHSTQQLCTQIMYT